MDKEWNYLKRLKNEAMEVRKSAKNYRESSVADAGMAVKQDAKAAELERAIKLLEDNGFEELGT